MSRGPMISAPLANCGSVITVKVTLSGGGARLYRATLCVSAVIAVVRCPSVTLMYCIQTAENIV